MSLYGKVTSSSTPTPLPPPSDDQVVCGLRIVNYRAQASSPPPQYPGYITVRYFPAQVRYFSSYSLVYKDMPKYMRKVYAYTGMYIYK